MPRREDLKEGARAQGLPVADARAPSYRPRVRRYSSCCPSLALLSFKPSASVSDSPWDATLSLHRQNARSRCTLSLYRQSMITGGTSMPVAPVAVLADDRLRSCVPALGAEDDEEDVDAEAGNWIERGGWAIVERAHVWAVPM